MADLKLLNEMRKLRLNFLIRDFKHYMIRHIAKFNKILNK